MFGVKLTDINMRTYGGWRWEQNVEQCIMEPHRGADLCSRYWFHYYGSITEAIFFNGIHAAFPPDTMRMFRVETGGFHASEDRKRGCSQLILLEEMPLFRFNPQTLILALQLVHQSMRGRNFELDTFIERLKLPLTNNDHVDIRNIRRDHVEQPWLCNLEMAVDDLANSQWDRSYCHISRIFQMWMQLSLNIKVFTEALREMCGDGEVDSVWPEEYDNEYKELL